MSFLRNSAFTIQTIRRAGQKIRLSAGRSKYGTDSEIFTKPDYELLDGTPGPLPKNQLKREFLERKFLEKVEFLAQHADDAASKSILPTIPSVKKHHKKDVDFHFKYGAGEDRSKQLRNRKKLPLGM